MEKPKLILDYDGVMSQIVQSGEAYRETLVHRLSMKAGLMIDSVVREFNRTMEKIMRKPWKYGCLVNGQCTAFGDEDPYMMCVSAAEALYNKNPDYRFCDNEAYQRFLEGLAHESAASACPGVDGGVKEAIEELSGRADISVVSGGRRERICSALEAAGIELNVCGRTDKMKVDTGFDRVKRYLWVDYAKKIELRRPDYYEILQSLRGDGSFSDMTVVGDVLSLDLALPCALGMKVVLKENPYTPGWSKEFVSQNGHVIGNLSQMTELI